MRTFALSLLALLVLTACGCTRSDPGQAALTLAFRGELLPSTHDLRHREGGLREQVDELFFRVNPTELKTALPKAGFIRDDSIPALLRGANSSFKALVGGADEPTAIGFRRADLKLTNGKYCHVLCAADYSWVYLVYVDFGPG